MDAGVEECVGCALSMRESLHKPAALQRESTTTTFPVSLFYSLWVFYKNLYAKGNAAPVISHREDTAHLTFNNLIGLNQKWKI
jgi:hypothetical protein